MQQFTFMATKVLHIGNITFIVTEESKLVSIRRIDGQFTQSIDSLPLSALFEFVATVERDAVEAIQSTLMKQEYKQPVRRTSPKSPEPGMGEGTIARHAVYQSAVLSEMLDTMRRIEGRMK